MSTYEADKSIMEAIKDSESNFKLTQSLGNQPGPLFRFVKTIGPNIKSQLNSLKNQAVCKKQSGAEKCNAKGCKTCKMLLTSKVIELKNKKVKLSHGSCKTPNICYLGVCQICWKPYTGRTVGPIHGRVNGHRHCYKEIVKRSSENTLHELDMENDLYSLGLHLHLDHGVDELDGFDRNMKFGILEVVNPGVIDTKEYKWMHKLNTFQPVGINVEYPFGIPYLG